MVLQGCATPAKTLTVKNMSEIQSIHIARAECPQFKRKTAGSEAVAFTGIMFGAIGGGLGSLISQGIESSEGKSLAAKCALPDFSKLVLDNFVARIQTDLPDWPKPMVVEKAISNDYKPNDYTIVISVRQNLIDSPDGLLTSTIARMNDPRGNVVWEKGFIYQSKDYSRSLKDPEADKGNLLRSELTFAAEKTANDFVQHLKYGDLAGKRSEGQTAPSSSSNHPEAPVSDG